MRALLSVGIMVDYLIALCICAERLLSLNCYFIVLVCLGGCGILVFVTCGLLGLVFAFAGCVLVVGCCCDCGLWLVYLRLLLG